MTSEKKAATAKKKAASKKKATTTKKAVKKASTQTKAAKQSAVKKSASKKSTAKKSTAKKSTAVTTKHPLGKPALQKIDPEHRRRMIAETSYFIAERRGFVSGSPTDDWLEAEVLVDRLLESGEG